MIKAPSLRKPFVDHWSEDPSFQQGPAEGEALGDYEARVKVAIETGDWSGLRVEGSGEPTAFTVRPMPADAYAKLADAKNAGMGENELFALAFRVVLQSVVNLGDAKVTFADDDRFGRIASLAFLEQAGISGAMGARICRELGSRALYRASGLGNL